MLALRDLGELCKARGVEPVARGTANSDVGRVVCGEGSD